MWRRRNPIRSFRGLELNCNLLPPTRATLFQTDAQPSSWIPCIENTEVTAVKFRSLIVFSLALVALLFAPSNRLDAKVRYPKTDPSQASSRELKRLPQVKIAPVKRDAAESALNDAAAQPETTAATPIAKQTSAPAMELAPAEKSAHAEMIQADFSNGTPQQPIKSETEAAAGKEVKPVSGSASSKPARHAAQNQVEADASTSRGSESKSREATPPKKSPDNQESARTKQDAQTDEPHATEETGAHGSVADATGTANADTQSRQSPKKLDATAEPDTTSTAEPATVVPQRKLTAAQIRLRDKLRDCLRYYYQRPEDISAHSPWGIMHCLIGYGVDTEIIAGNRRVNAIGWLCWNQPCRGMQLLDIKNDRVEPRLGPGYQGHEGQFLAMLALSRVKIDYSLRIEGKDLMVADLVKYEMATCTPRSELSFKLIGLSHYLKSDVTWKSEKDDEWSIERLIQDEITQPINGACCGGTHRLMGLSTAVLTRKKRNEPMTGQWLRADNFTRNYQNYALKLQNRDGSFSTDWLKRRADSGDMDRKVQTTGHILEWLVYSLPETQLTNPQIVHAVNYLANVMITQRRHEWEIGPRGHALHAMALYNERVFGDKPGQRRVILTGHATN